KYDGKPGLYDEWQTLENPALRRFLKLNSDVQGVVIRRPFDKNQSYPLKEWDVITRIGGTQIDDQGMIKLGSNLRVHFPYMVQHVAKNGKAPLTIIRDGKEIHIDLPVPSDYPLVVRDWRNEYPPYFIVGPVVFCEARSEMISGLTKVRGGPEWLMWLIVSGNPLTRQAGEKQGFPGQRLVYISSPFFPHKLSKGYGTPVLRVIQSVNNQPAKNLPQFVQL